MASQTPKPFLLDNRRIIHISILISKRPMGSSNRPRGAAMPYKHCSVTVTPYYDVGSIPLIKGNAARQLQTFSNPILILTSTIRDLFSLQRATVSQSHLQMPPSNVFLPIGGHGFYGDHGDRGGVGL